MATPREVKLRIRSVKNIAQVTRALEAVSASRVRRTTEALMRTRPYATKAWQVLTHIAGQPGRGTLHPLLVRRTGVDDILVVLISGDRGLAGAYYANIVRFNNRHFGDHPGKVAYIAVGRKGRDLLLRMGQDVIADFSNLPAQPSFADVSAIGRLAVEEFLAGRVAEVHLVYTDYVNLLSQVPTRKMILPLEYRTGEERVGEYEEGAAGLARAYIYEPGREQILDEIVPSFTALQVYQAVLEGLASEHAARMVAMRNATDNADDLADALQLEYNKARQLSITNEMLDIAGGAEALAQSRGR